MSPILYIAWKLFIFTLHLHIAPILIVQLNCHSNGHCIQHGPIYNFDSDTRHVGSPENVFGLSHTALEAEKVDEAEMIESCSVSEASY